MSRTDAITAAVDELARDGITVTVRAETRPVPGTDDTYEALYVHVVASSCPDPATWLTVRCRLIPICPSVFIA